PICWGTTPPGPPAPCLGAVAAQRPPAVGELAAVLDQETVLAHELILLDGQHLGGERLACLVAAGGQQRLVLVLVVGDGRSVGLFRDQFFQRGLDLPLLLFLCVGHRVFSFLVRAWRYPATLPGRRLFPHAAGWPPRRAPRSAQYGAAVTGTQRGKHPGRGCRSVAQRRHGAAVGAPADLDRGRAHGTYLLVVGDQEDLAEPAL